MELQKMMELPNQWRRRLVNPFPEALKCILTQLRGYHSLCSRSIKVIHKSSFAIPLNIKIKINYIYKGVKCNQRGISHSTTLLNC